MKIVIDILDDEYKKLVNPYQYNEALCDELKMIVRNGTPLLKGHGELVYREDVCNELRYMDNNGFITRSVNHVIEDIKKGVPTIIEADKSERS